MTEKQKELLRHALGLDYKAKSFRNFFATAPDCDTWEDVVALERAGLMVRGHEAIGGLTYFHATGEGRKEVGA